MNQYFTIKSLKYDRSVRRSWTCHLIEKEEDLRLFVGVFEFEVDHPELGLIKNGTVSYEYYWLNRWYNVFRFHESDGRFRNFYCNINMPPRIEGNVLNYVDLDIDILIWPDGRANYLDLDEFAENAARYNYADEVRSNAIGAVNELKGMLELRKFPFDNKYFN